ncbi:rust resistance kinase Lr10-like [Cryptomeria japonica]|uniref:rust resistance kinase Lr10-like n=1 Tax=Cryptomeria japonica TaxID=3369 RepID=UPI0027DA4964|nr:rust resistance kinase Lr10-like [Cryptomeria japonica]
MKVVQANTPLSFRTTIATTTSLMKIISWSSCTRDSKSNGISLMPALPVKTPADYVIILTHLIIIIILRRAFVLTVPTKTTVLTEYFYTTRNGRCSLNIKQITTLELTMDFFAALGAISGAFIISIIIFIYRRIRRKRKEREQQEQQDIRRFMDPLDSRPPSVANFLQAGIPNKYSHRQIKRYTNTFAVKLGQGGFGTVFKGDLANGCIVAIKILDKSKHSQIQFLNEVATIGRIHHLHLVRLLGYCLEGSKRALIYEYMVNGSLEKYIHGDDQNVLNWKQLYSIAMGTARAIAYLHDECRSKILYCDIKPHNVLLDVNFSPKVADFGLAKLTDREESHVSLTGARGTPGYVAPEVWSRNYGPITDRSDVYSYGMLVMEMVGGRKNFDMKAFRSSKFYYPEWAFKQVEMGEFQNLRGDNITDEEDEIVAKKLSF